MTRWTEDDLRRKGLKYDGRGGYILSKNTVEPKKNKYKAEKKEVDGITFDSKREGYMYSLLVQNNIEFKRQEKIIIQPGFKYLGETIREIYMKLDFVIIKNGEPVAMVDPKGMCVPEWLVKLKVLKHELIKVNRAVPIFIPKTDKDCRELIPKLLEILDQA